MAPPVDVVVVGRVRDQTRPRPRHMTAEVGAKPEVLDTLRPPPESQPGVVEFVLVRVLVDHPTHDVVEVRVAAVDHRPSQVVLGVRAVAANDVAVADDVRSGRDHTLLHADEALDHFEDGARTVGASDRAVVQGLPRVLRQTVVRRPPARSGEQVPVKRRGRHEGQDLARGRFEGHDGAAFAAHEVLGVPLQFGVQREREVVARDRQGIKLGQGVSHVVPHVHEVVSEARGSAQVQFVQAFNPRLPFVVAQPVARVVVHVLAVDLAVLAHDLACNAKDILSHGLRPNGQPWVFPKFCAERRVFLGVELAKQRRGFVPRVASGLVEPGHQIVFLEGQQRRQRRGVHAGHGARHHHQFVPRDVVHKQLAVAVQAKTSGGVKQFLFLGEALRAVAVFVRGDLHLEQADREDQPHGQHHGADDALTARKVVAVQLHG